MSEFDIFTIETKVEENNRQISTLKRTVKKIKENSEQVEVQSIERVNKVAFVSVSIPNTSDYLIKLGKQYFAKVKQKTAIEIIESRVKNLEEENQKWRGLNTKMSKQIEKRKKQMEQAHNRNQQIQRSMEVIGENEDGQQIFNIMEFGDTNNFRQNQQPIELPIISQQEQIILEKGQKVGKRQDQSLYQKPLQIETTEQKEEIKKQVKVEEKQILKTVQEKPKKISKFKSQRLQMKEKP